MYLCCMSSSVFWHLLCVMHLSMLSPSGSRRGGGVGQGVGILTFSEKMSQIPHPCDNINGQKYQKPTPFVQPLLTNVGSSFERLLGVFHDGGVFLDNLVPRAFLSQLWEGKALGTRLISKPSSLSKMVATSNSPPWGYVVQTKSQPWEHTYIHTYIHVDCFVLTDASHPVVLHHLYCCCCSNFVREHVDDSSNQQLICTVDDRHDR